MKAHKLDYKEVSNLFVYDYEEGALYWKVNARGGNIGDRAGHLHQKTGYRKIQIKGKRIQETRIAWTLFYGKNPIGCIDHIDGNRQNNKITNLRDVSHRENNMNACVRKHNKSGVRGVAKWKNRYQARITKDGVIHNLGWFGSVEEAKEARENAEKIMFGQFSSIGRKNND